MAKLGRAAGPSYPMMSELEAPVGWVEALRIVAEDGGRWIEIDGLVLGVEGFGWDDARFTSRIPLPAGYALVRLAEEAPK